MTLDSYVLALLEHLFKRPFQVDDWVHKGRCDPYFLFCNFHVLWYLLERRCVAILIYNIFLEGVCLFVVLNVVVFKILWADDNWFPSIIILLQYPTASYINNTNYVNLINKWERYPFWISFSTTNNKLYVKGDQTYTCNQQPTFTLITK